MDYTEDSISNRKIDKKLIEEAFLNPRVVFMDNSVG